MNVFILFVFLFIFLLLLVLFVLEGLRHNEYMLARDSMHVACMCIVQTIRVQYGTDNSLPCHHRSPPCRYPITTTLFTIAKHRIPAITRRKHQLTTLRRNAHATVTAMAKRHALSNPQTPDATSRDAKAAVEKYVPCACKLVGQVVAHVGEWRSRSVSHARTHTHTHSHTHTHTHTHKRLRPATRVRTASPRYR